MSVQILDVFGDDFFTDCTVVWAVGVSDLDVLRAAPKVFLLLLLFVGPGPFSFSCWTSTSVFSSSEEFLFFIITRFCKIDRLVTTARHGLAGTLASGSLGSIGPMMDLLDAWS